MDTSRPARGIRARCVALGAPIAEGWTEAFGPWAGKKGSHNRWDDNPRYVTPKGSEHRP